jgi:pantoate--beta-alanine ligase
MGALHSGHLSLIKQCLKNNKVSVVSIFVNPTQFNNTSDLINYPKNLKKDIELLENLSKKIIIFSPEAKEIYTDKELTNKYDFNGLDKFMEGKFRNNHFEGVATIVELLLKIIKPNSAYFGEKDFQQLCIIKYFVKQNNIPVQIIGCPIIREKDGLALSSRNVRLTYEQRKIAPVIYKILKKAKEKSKYLSVEEVKIWARTEINKNNIMKLEYFEIVDIHSLKSISKWSDTKKSIACIAVYLEKIRLIDNIIL